MVPLFGGNSDVCTCTCMYVCNVHVHVYTCIYNIYIDFVLKVYNSLNLLCLTGFFRSF